MARLLRAMPELMILIKGMLAASRSVVFTLLLLVILMYVFAIAMTQLMTETATGASKFSTVLQSMYTLWLHGTLLDDVNGLQAELRKDSIVCTIIFFVFVLLASLTVMNMLIGVLCEVVSAVAQTEREEMLVNYVNDKLKEVVLLLDRDGDMKISKGEFMQILENPEACRCLEDVGVDVVGLIDSVDAIFTDKSYDVNAMANGGDANLQLDFPKFMEVVLALRGTNNATVKDVVELRKFVRDAMVTTSVELRSIQAHVHALQISMARMSTGPPGQSWAINSHPLDNGLTKQHMQAACFSNGNSLYQFEADKPSPPMAPSAARGQKLPQGSERGVHGVRRRRRKGEDTKTASPSKGDLGTRQEADGDVGEEATQAGLLECLEVPSEHTPAVQLSEEFMLDVSDGDASAEDCNEHSDGSNHHGSDVHLESVIDTKSVDQPAGLWSCCPVPSDERKHIDKAAHQDHPSKARQDLELDMHGNRHAQAKEEKSVTHLGKAYCPDHAGATNGLGCGDDLQFLTMKVGRSMSMLLSDLELMHRVVHTRPLGQHVDRTASHTNGHARTNGHGYRRVRRASFTQQDDFVSTGSAACSN
mmetsp:Transcript_14045/g.31813  ORF Transcript_14045/g.31813 Transcript_14045/m.31813 type:complete len:589 (+) Transcript_14045:3-1769(+)